MYSDNGHLRYPSFSSHILRLTQHNKRSHERLTELQRCLDQIKGTITGQNTYDQLRDILRLVALDNASGNRTRCVLVFLFQEILSCQTVKRPLTYRTRIVPERNSIPTVHTLSIIYPKSSVNRTVSVESSEP